MINIFFVPGMFGTSLEYMLRNFTYEFTPVLGEVLDDGSMHSFWKECHVYTKDTFKQRYNDKVEIVTSTFPWSDTKLKDIIKNWPETIKDSKNIFVKADSLYEAEINLLFQYYKIANGNFLQRGIQVFCGHTDNLENVSKWNSNYTHWSQFEPWELREWFSLFYESWVSEWIDIENDIKSVDNKLILNNNNILKNLDLEFKKIVNHCKLSIKEDDKYHKFLTDWTSKQQYILTEFYLLDEIINNTISNEHLIWNKLNFVSESILQRRLRQQGYEIKCYNLNEFPTNSKQLYKLLEKI